METPYAISIDPELEKELYRNSYFDRYELRLLFGLIGGEEEISISHIITLLRADDHIKRLLHYLFRTMNTVREDGHMHVSEFIKTMSIVSRGSKTERLELVFNLCDQDNDQVVSRAELVQLARLAEELLGRYHFGNCNMATPEESAYDIFGIEGEPKAKDRLKKKEFMTRAELDPDTYRCFGLFDYFYYMLIKPIEEQLHHDVDKPKIRGKLYRAKRFAFITWYIESVVEVRDGFFITYKKYKTHTVHKVVCLQNATIRMMNDQELRAHKRTVGAKIQTTQQKRKNSIANVEVTADMRNTHFIVSTKQRNYVLIARDELKAIDWISTLRANARGGYQFQSFAPVRHNVSAKWYANAAEYFWDVADAIKIAEKEIFITNWWLVPKLYLKREVYPLDKRFRLDQILLERAQAGVKVCVLIWDESNLGVNLGSRYAKITLEKLHKNIRVIRHPRFSLTWSHHQKTVIVDQNIAFLGGIDLCPGRYDDDTYTLHDHEAKLFPDDDYRNACLVPTGRPALTSAKPVKMALDRKRHVRMPWHDTAIRIEGTSARDVAFNFIQRWNHAKQDNRNSVLRYPSLAPSKDEVPENPGTCTCQILRSVSEWSAGQPVEDSIYKAHLNLINTAQHFIYIQNQYFISSTTANRPKNKIALALARRIKRAIDNNEKFRVIVLLPVHSEGFLAEKRTSVLVEWNLRTIHAIVYELEKEYPEAIVWNYISFNCLRNWSASEDKVLTEQVYVHSKLMIVDDEWAIIGSANINDRSMRGTRDSEIAALVRDLETVDSVMNGQPVKVAKFAHSMRMRLWKIHLGIQDDKTMTKQIMDPVCDATYHGIWRSIARQNTSIYVDTFGVAIPEACTRVEECDRTREVTKEQAKDMFRIKGLLVEYPFKLLADDAQAPANPPKWFSKVFL